MLLIGLTGSIATGKSACSKRLTATDGVTVIDCDALVHELQTPNSEAVLAIKKVFPTCVDEKNNNTLDRAALGQLIFSDPSKRRQLASIMNRRIFIAIIKRLVFLWWAKPSQHIVILDAPTLYESKMFVHIVSSVIVVSCSEAKQLARLMARNNFTREEALARMKSQISSAEKRLLADFVIDNDADGEAQLDSKVADAVEWIRKTQNNRKFPMILAGVVAVVSLATVGSAALLVKGLGKLVTF